MDVGEAVRLITGRFEAAGIDSARLDARVLVGFALNISPEAVFGYPERVLEEREVSRLSALADRREKREPLARIVGEKEFWSLKFRVTEDTLVPRPDTETVVEAVLDQINDVAAPRKILDLGTGTGCLLISLLSELPHSSGIGVDISRRALKTAEENADLNAVGQRARFLENDWCKGLTKSFAGEFDIIVSNPPYIPNHEIERLAPEVSGFEPVRALAGGNDGLDIYRLLVRDAKALALPGGIMAFETGWNQAEQVAELGRDEGLELLQVRSDLAGIPRCVMFLKPECDQV
jgi:release factor glutamine methyltransferase